MSPFSRTTPDLFVASQREREEVLIFRARVDLYGQSADRLHLGEHRLVDCSERRQDLVADDDLEWLTRAAAKLVQRAAAISSGATGLPLLTTQDI